MSNYYVKENNFTTILRTIPEVVTYLEDFVKRKFQRTRKQWMQDLVELGHGSDDPAGKVFTESMQEYVEIGAIKDKRYVKCKIHDIANFNKPEYGN